MKLSPKKITLTATLTVALCAPGLAFAQTAQQAAPIAVSELAQQDELRGEVVEIGTDRIRAPRKASWDGKRVALKGRDVVSFWQADGVPVKGSKKYVADYDNTKWRFASEENRDEFLKDPEKYVPEFGGFCPVALADNKAKIGTTTHFNVVGDKLYMNYNLSSKNKFKQDPDNFLVRAKLNF